MSKTELGQQAILKCVEHHRSTHALVLAGEPDSPDGQAHRVCQTLLKGDFEECSS